MQTFVQAPLVGIVVPSAIVEGEASGLLAHLGAVLKEEREKQGVILAEVVATLKRRGGKLKTDGPLSRFEHGQTTPNHLDDVIGAYAEVLGMDWLDLWLLALNRAKGAPLTDSHRVSLGLPR